MIPLFQFANTKIILIIMTASSIPSVTALLGKISNESMDSYEFNGTISYLLGKLMQLIEDTVQGRNKVPELSKNFKNFLSSSALTKEWIEIFDKHILSQDSERLTIAMSMLDNLSKIVPADGKAAQRKMFLLKSATETLQYPNKRNVPTLMKKLSAYPVELWDLSVINSVFSVILDCLAPIDQKEQEKSFRIYFYLSKLITLFYQKCDAIVNYAEEFLLPNQNCSFVAQSSIFKETKIDNAFCNELEEWHMIETPTEESIDDWYLLEEELVEQKSSYWPFW